MTKEAKLTTWKIPYTIRSEKYDRIMTIYSTLFTTYIGRKRNRITLSHGSARSVEHIAHSSRNSENDKGLHGELTIKMNDEK